MDEVRIIGQRGPSDFLIEAGSDDDGPLGRVYFLETDELSPEALPVPVITGRGYWEDVTASKSVLDDVRVRVAAAT